MIGFLSVILLATTCLSSELSSITDIESNGLQSSSLLNGLKDIIEKLGIDVEKIKELSTTNDPELIALAKSTTVIVFFNRIYIVVYLNRSVYSLC